jgi:hypothetical protein
MSKKVPAIPKASPPETPVAEPLLQRVSAILDRAQTAVARAINSEMVLAYWHIGRERVAFQEAIELLP